MSKELIKIITKDGNNLVSAIELHEFLVVKSRFNDWINNRINKYEFEENQDYTTLTKNLVNGGKETDYIITTDMAKELSMVENNDKGKQARKYFIQCEKGFKGMLGVNNHKTYIDHIEDTKAELTLIEQISGMLRLNDTSKLMLMTKSFENNGINTNLLPSYTKSEGILKSATELLKLNNVNISAQKFNSLLVEKGILKECTRPSSKDSTKVKKFKNLVNTYYGENLVNPRNTKETQPMYYEDKFKELLKEINY